MWPEGDIDLEAISSEENAAQTLQKIVLEAAQNGDDARLHDVLTSDHTQGLIDINEADPTSGGTPLGYASCYGHEKAVAELLSNGADANQEDKNEWTPLMWAVNINNVGITRLLLDAGADLRKATSTGRTALDVCSPSSNSAVYNYLADKGYISVPTIGGNGSGLGESNSSENVYLRMYQPAADPDELDAEFAARLEESSNSLGLGATGGANAGAGILALDEPVIVGGGDNLLFPDVGFDWDTFHISQSFALQVEDIPHFLDLVVTQFQPTLQRNQAPVSASAIYLAARYLHHSFSGKDAVWSLMSPVARRIQLVVEAANAHAPSLAHDGYWLANVQLIIYFFQRDHDLKDAYTEDVLPTLANLAENLQGLVVSGAQRLLDPLLAPCMLDFENIVGISDVRYRDGWNMFNRSKKPPPSNDSRVAEQGMLPPTEAALRKPAPRNVTSVLSSLELLLLQIYPVHPRTVAEILSQILYWLSAALLNSIVDRRRYLSRARAMQIRLNVSSLEDWCRVANFRPESVTDIEGVTHEFKSLIEIGRAHLAPLTQLLQWLQCFSGFGSDFGNVVAAMQELKSLNPVQLLHAAKKYRVETHEPVLSKEYRDYLAQLAEHYQSTLRSQSIMDVAETDPKVEATESCVDRAYKEPRTEGVDIDASLVLPTRLPSLREGVLFWGGSFGTRKELVPAIPAEIVDALDEGVTNQRHNGTSTTVGDDADGSKKEEYLFEEKTLPAASHKPWTEQDEEEDYSNPW